MKKDDVQIGKIYIAKVSGGVVPVRITQEKWNGDKHVGWVGVNTTTNRSVHVKSAQRLRAEVKAGELEVGEPAPQDAPAAEAAAKNASGAVAGAGVATVARAGSPKPRRAKGGKTPKGRSPKTKPVKTPKAAKPPKAKRVSGLDAAAQVLAHAKKPLRCAQMMEAIREKGLWTSGGKTPEATIYAAIIREIAAKGKMSRFKKIERGTFAATSQAMAEAREG